jgi:DNA-binding beta-propeller fold protein YncE
MFGSTSIRLNPSSIVLLVQLFAFLSAGCSVGPAEKLADLRSNPTLPSDGFTNFETEPVCPLVLSGDGRYLYAVNTADDRLEIFATSGGNLRSIGETTVGLRPVAIALSGDEAWVVNHLSDSVSVVDVHDPTRPRVTRTLQVGDEPRGIVAAGPKGDRMFVATARRADTLTPGIGRAQLWVFETRDPQAPAKVVTLFGAKPRSLASSLDGRTVYAAVFLSGNGTTSVSGEDAVRLGRAPQWSLTNIPYSAMPKQGAIVKRRDGVWRDFAGRDWNAVVPFELPDSDVFVIDAAADQPRVTGAVSNVGTVLFNLAVQPGSGEIWVSNTEAFNLIPYEPRLSGRFAENRITRIIPQSDSTLRGHAVNLNSHVEPSRPADPGALRELSLAQPLQIVFQSDGKRAYVAAFGSKKIAVLDQNASVVDRIAVGFGPGGLALDANTERLYVLNHLDATISLVSTRTLAVLTTVPLRYNPTPPLVRAGRRVFYDAALTSRYGDLSCATCHVFADMDGLAWDLGDPSGSQVEYPVKLRNVGLGEPRQALHPLKGPMTTQSLRGLANTAPYHWRGDRFGHPLAPGQDIPSFMDFSPAFVDLLGRSAGLSDSDMEALARYVLTIRYPPNPYQRLDRTMDGETKAGFEFFTGPFLSDIGEQNCVGCHELPVGTNRLVNFEGIQIGRDMKTPHLRNLYDKVGRFNVAGPQVSGFSFLHDGTVDSVVSFLRFDVFFFPGRTEAEKDVVRRQLHNFIMAFDTGMAPSVGRQLTVNGELSASERQMLDLLGQRAAAGDCDLIARAWEGKSQRGWLLRNAVYYSDRSADAPLTLGELLERHRRSGEPLTFTCVPPGDGRRSAIDRDLDGVVDGDEMIARSDLSVSRGVPR